LRNQASLAQETQFDLRALGHADVLRADTRLADEGEEIGKVVIPLFGDRGENSIELSHEVVSSLI
jgi:hypothetical protein